MLKIITIVGARPQFIKAAAISRAIRDKFPGRVDERIVHSGQHYDDNMSQVFFREMEIPEPAHYLATGSGTHGHMTGEIILRTEKILLEERPDAVIVYGDTNTTLAGAIAASKLHIPVVHIEAGLRSFKKAMPEEINRVLCDHVSTLLFTPTLTGLKNLVREGFNPDAVPPFTADNPKIYHCGDVMFDNALYFGEKAENHTRLFDELKVEKGKYVLCTIHRDNNTDNSERLSSLLGGLGRIATGKNIPVVLPVHPRTRKMMAGYQHRRMTEDLIDKNLMILTQPLSYLDMLLLEKNASVIMTDSGGVQKESYFFRKPCIVLRDETEWLELLDNGSTVLAGADEDRIVSAYDRLAANPPSEFPPVFGDGKASEFIVNELISFTS